MSRGDDPGFVSEFVRYFPGILTLGLTLGVSVTTHLPIPSPGLLVGVALAVPPAALLASVAVFSDRRPSGIRLFAFAGLSWLVFSLARVPLLDPISGRIVGSPFALLDLGLVWLGSYAVACAVVYCVDWPTVDADMDTDADRDSTRTDFADD
ncbi:hypothetical protein [Salinibaculum rarum]|uniref:hypothetical protein n=1 Tax=Salinibaculum rarum TaxID=3058903 RepID=UPI00265F6A78|nr:hypothetical protein [Salinibaculum sp. KK48]